MKERKGSIRKGRGWTRLALLALLSTGCGGGGGTEATDTADEGVIHISADESFKPVIDSQVQVYESSHPGAKIIVHYKPEVECLKDFAVDSIRMIIATRGYTPAEGQFIMDSLKVQPSKMVMAHDAIAVIVHPQSPDTLMSMEQVRNLLTGRGPKGKVAVFDGTKATSTVRFIVDSVLRGEKLSPDVVAAQTSEGVIDYIAGARNAVGFIGVSWIGNREDTTQLNYLSKVKVVQLQHIADSTLYVSPAQYNIYYRRYPMVRDLIYTLKEKHNGLGHAFAYFLTGQRGQLIFKRAYLMPAQMRFNLRSANLREE